MATNPCLFGVLALEGYRAPLVNPPPPIRVNLGDCCRVWLWLGARIDTQQAKKKKKLVSGTCIHVWKQALGTSPAGDPHTPIHTASHPSSLPQDLTPAVKQMAAAVSLIRHGQSTMHAVLGPTAPMVPLSSFCHPPL